MFTNIFSELCALCGQIFQSVKWCNMRSLIKANLLAAFLLLSSAFFSASGAQTNQTLVPAEVYSFGATSAHDMVYHNFVVSNSGVASLVLTKVRPSCECLHILSWPRVIPPNANGEIAVRLAPDKTGAVDYKVFVESEDQAVPVRVYVIRGTITPPPAGSRPNPDLIAVNASLLTRVITPRDESCYITADILRSRLAFDADIRLIDVRPAPVFNELHMPAAWNLALYAVKAQNQLRSFSLVLVDAYGGDPTLEQACRELRRNGFASVWILRGGLNGWRQAGGALEGNPAAMDKLAVLSPADFDRVRNFSDWVVVTDGANQASRAAFLFPDAVPLARLADYQLPSTPARKVNILLLAGNVGKATADLAAALKKTKTAGVCVFTLEGGVAGYEAYLKMCSAQPEKRLTQTRAKTSAVRGGVTKKPCGGCPG